MAITLTDDVKRLFDGPNFAHLATVMPDGSPQSAPVWVTREGDRILVGTGEGSLKAKNTRRDPRVALSIVDGTNPYVEAQIRGRPFVLAVGPRARATSGVEIRDELAFQARDLVLQHQFAFLQPLHLQLVGVHVEREAHDDLIEVPMLDAQVPQLLEVAKQLAVDVVFGFRHRRRAGLAASPM